MYYTEKYGVIFVADINEIMSRITCGRCEIIGLGRSNLPLCAFLSKKGATNIIGRDGNANFDKTEELEKLGVTVIKGENYLEGIGGNEPENTLVFRSPGIRPDVPQIKAAVDSGAILTSEMELFFELTKATVIGITGSDGKTTTTTFVSKLLSLECEKRGGGAKVYLGGNIGKPLLPDVDEMAEKDFAVVELSSFQLMTMKKSPSRSVITNITPNHLNWHIDMDEYIEAKKNIYLHAPCESLTVNLENNVTAEIGKSANIKTTFFSSAETPDIEGKNIIFVKDGNIVYYDGKTEKKILSVSDIKLPGRHNVENYMAAISATYGFVSLETIKEIATTFGGVEHRLELVRELRGVKYYNSSIDTSPTRTEAALSTFANKVIIICGGSDKHVPFDTLADALCKRAKTVVLTGATAGKIKDAVLACGDYAAGGLEIIEEKEFENAVKAASDAAVSGDVVILSPACASFDAFKNFEERGNFFKKIVNDLK